MPRGSNFFFRRQLARFVLEHNRNVVAYRISESARAADQLRLTFSINKRSLAERANQNVE
jgi:hypothetical protein